MGICLTSCFLLSLVALLSNYCVVFAGKQPPNEWGTYYNLPSKLPEMQLLFETAFAEFLNDVNPSTECQLADAEFNRWYQSARIPDYYILSYYCKTKTVREHEHVKVSKSRAQVLDFEKSLSGFDIVDAGDYEDQLDEERYTERRNEYLEKVAGQMKEQVQDSWSKNEICPNPGTKVPFSMMTKEENGLHYYKIAISCNKTEAKGIDDYFYS